MKENSVFSTQSDGAQWEEATMMAGHNYGWPHQCEATMMGGHNFGKFGPKTNVTTHLVTTEGLPLRGFSPKIG